MHKPIETSLQLQFQSERLKRTIEECENFDLLKDIALELVELNRQKTVINQWISRRALDAENKINQFE